MIGKQVHDARIAAVMNVHRIANFLTFNVGDFAPYGINAVSPESIPAD